MVKTAVFLSVLSAISAAYGFEVGQHHDYNGMVNVMKEVNARCPDITRLYSLPMDNQFKVPDHTWQKRKLWVIEFAKTPGQHSELIPEFKYIGNMHGNEVTGRELLLNLIRYMCDVYNGDIETRGLFTTDYVKALIDNTRIHIMPSMNPDGWEKAAHSVDNYQDGVTHWLTGRENANKTDLNRDFPDLDKLYYKTMTKPGHKNNHLDKIREVFKNLTGQLEPETMMVMSWIHTVPFVLSANMHNGDLVANYPFDETRDGSPHKYSASPDDVTFKYLAESYSLVHAEMAQPHKPCDNNDFSQTEGTTNGAAWYSVPGGMQDYNYMSTNCMEITLELGCSKFPPAYELPKLWADNLDSLFNFMFQSHIGFKGRVLSPPGKDLVASIRVKNETSGKIIDHDVTSTKYGDYYRLIEDGMYTVTATVTLQGEDGSVGELTRTQCVDVHNSPYDLNNFNHPDRIVDFDFTDLTVEHAGTECKDGESDYYDIVRFLQQYAYQNGNKNPIY